MPVSAAKDCRNPDAHQLYSMSLTSVLITLLVPRSRMVNTAGGFPHPKGNPKLPAKTAFFPWVLKDGYKPEKSQTG